MKSNKKDEETYKEIMGDFKERFENDGAMAWVNEVDDILFDYSLPDKLREDLENMFEEHVEREKEQMREQALIDNQMYK